MTIEKRADFLGLWNDACGSSQVLWTGSTLEAAAQEWRRLVAAGESDVSLTTYGRGEVASHHEMEWRYGTPKASFACPICGKETPHEHTGEAIAWHRNMEAWKQRDMEKRWERIEARIAELAAISGRRPGDVGVGLDHLWRPGMSTTSDLAARLAELEQQVVQLTRERDEWAAKWQRMSRKYAELRWPGLTRIITGKDAYGVPVTKTTGETNG